MLAQLRKGATGPYRTSPMLHLPTVLSCAPAAWRMMIKRVAAVLAGAAGRLAGAVY